ncbi:MAG: hypothetical protein ACI4OE_07090 [Alphaproteobacteria bacterium]
MDYLALIISFCAGIWNVLQDTSRLIRRKVCAFMLGFIFCYGAMVVANTYGLSHDVSAFVGYVCGVLSVNIYNMAVECLNRIPEIFSEKLRGNHDCNE